MSKSFQRLPLYSSLHLSSLLSNVFGIFEQFHFVKIIDSSSENTSTPHPISICSSPQLQAPPCRSLSSPEMTATCSASAYSPHSKCGLPHRLQNALPMAIFERLDGRYILCHLAIVDVLGVSIFSCYLCDLVTIIVPQEKSLRRRGVKALTYTPVVQDLNVCSTYEVFN